jgi:hypothetical protein
VTVAGSNLAGVTQAENWLFLTDFPFFVSLSSLDISGIQEKIEFTIVVRNFHLTCRNSIRMETPNFEFSFSDLNPHKSIYQLD